MLGLPFNGSASVFETLVCMRMLFAIKLKKKEMYTQHTHNRAVCGVHTHTHTVHRCTQTHTHITQMCTHTDTHCI